MRAMTRADLSPPFVSTPQLSRPLSRLGIKKNPKKASGTHALLKAAVPQVLGGDVNARALTWSAAVARARLSPALRLPAPARSGGAARPGYLVPLLQVLPLPMVVQGWGGAPHLLWQQPKGGRDPAWHGDEDALAERVRRLAQRS